VQDVVESQYKTVFIADVVPCDRDPPGIRRFVRAVFRRLPGEWRRRDDEGLVLEVTVQQGCLRICAERRAPEENRDYWHNERQYGRFERVISLPDVVDADSIDAEMRNGVLCVRLVKKPEAQPKKVAIKAE
jgi:hypothetical protein